MVWRVSAAVSMLRNGIFATSVSPRSAATGAWAPMKRERRLNCIAKPGSFCGRHRDLDAVRPEPRSILHFLLRERGAICTMHVADWPLTLTHGGTHAKVSAVDDRGSHP